MNPYDSFDFRHPDYLPIFRHRIKMLERLRADPALLKAVKAYYATDAGTIDFIRDWGTLYEPRNADIDLPTYIPFVPFPRQVEWLEWVLQSWRARRPGVTPKSRESGVSWLAIALAVTLCLFRDGINIGFGSRKEEYVDLLGAPKSLFWKARKFIELLPPEFRNGFDLVNDAPKMRLLFKANGSAITGEIGDSIGRGDRQTIYFIDEADFLEHPMMAEGGLQATTNCPIYISTANGVGGPFYEKVHQWEPIRVFRFHWRDDPRKDEEWYNDQLTKWDPVTIAREVDINFSASVEGIIIRSEWVQSAIDAHIKLGFEPTGERLGALDVADLGADSNAFCVKHGQLIEHIEEWKGSQDNDIFHSVAHVFAIADDRGLDHFRYDADGMGGAGVRAAARLLNEDRNAKIDDEPFLGSGSVLEPEAEDSPGRQNKDWFENRKAQEWLRLAKLFQTTHRAVTGASVAAAQEYDPNDIISISSAIPANVRSKLVAELSQPTVKYSKTGKVMIDKAPEGTRSPNLADAVMICCAQATNAPLRIHADAMDEIRAMSRRRMR